ncbi:MAG: CoA transferase, partial [Desulfobacterales bacterium]
LTIMAMDYFATGKAPERWGLDHIHRVPARAFLASDGRWVQVAATSDLMYAKFCRTLGKAPAAVVGRTRGYNSQPTAGHGQGRNQKTD